MIPGWAILNFYTGLLLVLLLVFQYKTMHTESGDRFSQLVTMTLILLVAETVGHACENIPQLLHFTKVGYYIIYALDPANYLFAILYINCWMNDSKKKVRHGFILAYKIFNYVNIVLVSLSAAFNLKWFYYFEDATYHRGQFFLVRVVLLMIFGLLLFAYTFIFKNCIYEGYQVSIFILPILSTFGMFLQAILPDYDMTYAAITIGIVIMFFYLQAKNLDIDYLTGALNRRGIDIKFDDCVKNAISSNKKFSAIMLDLDKFKEINDDYGHNEGDYALKAMTEILRRVFWNEASIGRFGGDEFCIVADITDEAALKGKISLIECALEEWNEHSNKPYSLQCSIGAMVYDPAKAMTRKEFQIAIDELMYKEKRKHHLAENRRSRVED